jgi:glycosyltransferase involved in cell wall biosynthesis
VLIDDKVEQLSTAALLQELALVAKRSSDLSATWLLHLALVGVFPESEQVSDLRRRLALSGDATAMLAVLESTVDVASREGGSKRHMRLVSDRVIVDVNFCATHDHNTGVQRVVRKTMPHWASADLPVVFVAWTPDGDGYRVLDRAQRERVLNWDARGSEILRLSDQERADAVVEEEELIVPWRTTLFLPEVPFEHLCRKLATIAMASGNEVRLIGYDAIPLASAESQPPHESERFAHYLTIVKHSTMVIGISESASAEFAGFGRALEAQGLRGPTLRTTVLAREAPLDHPRSLPSNAPPMVLCVGSHEPRKNQDSVLHAGELLHSQGLKFELIFVGGGSPGAVERFDSRVRRSRKRGFAVKSLRRATDLELFDLYGRARFSVFVSLHEGYGLPVVESLVHGTPVLTSNFGSLAEIAGLGGCIQVDPRDDSAIIEGMRQLLVDDTLLDRLSTEARAIPLRPWPQYAEELWAQVTEPALVTKP